MRFGQVELRLPAARTHAGKAAIGDRLVRQIDLIGASVGRYVEAQKVVDAIAAVFVENIGKDEETHCTGHQRPNRAHRYT